MQINEPTIIPIYYDLTLCDVEWHPYYVLFRASLGQIMFSLSRVLELLPKNIYEKTLYSNLKSIIIKLIKEYDIMLKCSNKIEREVKFYNLIGKMPYLVKINEEEHNIKLHKPKIGKIIAALKQRVNFILTRNIPQFYKNNEIYLNEFQKMQEQIKKFKEKVYDFELNFIEAIDHAHKANQENYK